MAINLHLPFVIIKQNHHQPHIMAIFIWYMVQIY